MLEEFSIGASVCADAAPFFFSVSYERTSRLRSYKNMNLINLTPHAINIVNGPTLAPSGHVARVSNVKREAGAVNGVTLFTLSKGEVTGLPESAEDTMFVVSAQVREAVPHRTDVASPGDLVRGPDGQPVGCQGLVVNEG